MAVPTPDESRHPSAHERPTPIERLWDSLAGADVSLPDARRSELEGRLDTFESDRLAGRSWEDLKAELAARAP